MKVLGIILIVLVVAALGFVAYFWLFQGPSSANMTVTYTDCIAADPVEFSDEFARLKEQRENGTFIGTVFSDLPLGSPEEYVFYTWTVHLSNQTRIPAKVVEIQIVPMDGDVLQYPDTEIRSIQPGQEIDLTATVLTARNKHRVREAIVTWYFWGKLFTERITVGQPV